MREVICINKKLFLPVYLTLFLLILLLLLIRIDCYRILNKRINSAEKNKNWKIQYHNDVHIRKRVNYDQIHVSFSWIFSGGWTDSVY